MNKIHKECFFINVNEDFILFFFMKNNIRTTKPHRNVTITIGETSLIANLAAIAFPACPNVAINSNIVALLNKNIKITNSFYLLETKI
jgi:hypothetical protein